MEYRENGSNVVGRTTPKKGNLISLLEKFEQEAKGVGTIRTPFQWLNLKIGGGLRKGFTSVLSGPPGNGKSYFVYRMMFHFMMHNVRAVYMPLEYNAAEHLRRITATMVGSWSLVDDDAKKAQQRIDAFMKYPQMIRDFERMEMMVCENPAKVVLDAYGEPVIPEAPYSDILEMVKHHSKTADIVIIDPITAIDQDKIKTPEFEQQTKFIRAVNAIADHSNVHIMLVGHTRKRQKHNGKESALTMDDMAGSVALSRFSQYMFLMDYHEKKKSIVTITDQVIEEAEHARTLMIAKTNFGYGKGHKIAFDFSDGPIMEELGWLNPNSDYGLKSE